MSLPKSLDAQAESKYTNPYAVDVIRTKRRDLVYGISHTEDLLNLLVTHGVITAVKRSIVLTLRSRKDQNSRILDIVESRGERACRKFFHPCLMLAEPELYQRIKTFVGDVNEHFQDPRRQLIGYLLEMDKVIKTSQNEPRRTNNRRNILELKKVEDKLTKGMSDLIQLIATNGDMALLEKFLNDTDINTVNSSKNTLLHVAAEHGNVSAAELLICKGAKVDLQNNTGCTALHRAASRGHTDIVKALIQAGAPIHVVDDQGRTPVHLAAEQLQLESVSVLVKEEASQPESLRKNTFLHMAGREDNWKLMELLLQNGAPVDAMNNQMNTALFYAVQESNSKAVEVLLNAGAKVNFDIINEALKSKQDTILQLLLDKSQGFLGEDVLGPALFTTVRLNQDRMMDLLIKGGADVNIWNKKRYTPLLLSAELGHTEVFRVLVAENADLDVRLSDFSSALHLGVQSGNTSIVRALLEKGMDPDIKTVKGFTPLHVAAHYDRAEIVALLVKGGAQVNSVDQQGLTPLHIASQLAHTDVVVQLVQGKAATEVKDRQGRTALHLAAHSGGKSSLIDLLLSANSNVNVSDNEKKTALHLAAMDGDKHVVASLLSHKAKVLVRDMDGSTPLHYAAAGGHASIVSILLRSVNNRGLEDRNAWRKTSLHVAAEKGHDGVVVVLLETGAKVNATDQSKDTPLHCAARGGHPSVVERLLNWGQTGPKGQQNMVNLQMTNKVGKTALQVAESENSPQHENISIILKKRMLLIK
ncbi:CARD- and ANK-domain containing inflammasome adapter protein [Gouania willdenowi]|uniref:CARD- and ANK-domain containing inflammasome adapter protein n=1 Tax=Gouania willdenowi TaxID=441366 RepID=UPI001056D391|nr:ankyrin-3-like [Gouania willdenowi]